MKKIIELALKSGEVNLKGVINLVDCIDKNFQERAVMLLTGNDDIPEEVNISDKGISFDTDGNIAYEYTCMKYNYLYNEVIANKSSIQNENNHVETVTVSFNTWQRYRKSYIDSKIMEKA